MNMKKIAIDISQIVYKTGVSVYTENLVKLLKKLDQENDYLFFGGAIKRKKDLKKYSDKVFPISPKIADFLFNKIHFIPIEFLVGNIDVYHSSDWTQAKSGALKITTVHDMSPIFEPKFTNTKIVNVHKRRLSWVKKEVDFVIAPSESTKKDLIKYGINDKKIKVIYESYDLNLIKSPKVKRNKPFLLSVGNNARKNTENIIKAFLNLKDNNLDLVIVGEKHQKNLNYKNVYYTGFVSDKELGSLYKSAECLVYPSISEGFGLPILQAMAVDVPVVTSNLSSMPEVSGDAAVLVDPFSIEDISFGINKALKEKNILIKKGQENIKKYSWEKTVREHIEIYNL